MTSQSQALRPIGLRSASKVLVNVQALRAIAALLVVLAHVGGFELKTFGEGAHWLAAFHQIGSTGVDIFFVISGIIMVVTTSGAKRGLESSVDFLWRRIKRVYPPYFIVTAAVFAVYLWNPSMVNSSQAAPPDPLASFLLLPQPGLPLLLVGWTLVFEMYFYIVFAMGLLVRKAAFPAVLGAWALATASLAALQPEGYLMEFFANPLHFEFLFGAVIGYFFVNGKLWKPGLITLVGTVVSLTVWALMATGMVPGIDDPWFRVFAIGVSLAAVVYGLIGLENSGEFRFAQWLVKLGDSSYSLYLTHVLTIAVFGIAFEAIPKTPATHLGALVALLIACIIGGLVFYHLVERPLVRLLKRGNRS
ncbi:acyltransferase [Arthrobacter crystallopoietes]|uniref:acyltransferase family protein n=1 Tax=Crystallibacter crystallopoietes TaxID=37928 RepID=UPI003D22BF1D